MISIVIPAHNEEQVIGRCLSSILGDAEPGEFDVVVVTNGCTDRTAEVASRFDGVRVVDSPVASKPAALNLGDEVAKGFPRLYIDADVEVGAAAIRAVAAALGEEGVLLAAPTMLHELRGRPWAVKAYLDIWTRLPFATDAHVGTGFYGLSAEARALFDRFPETMAEDLYIHSLAPAFARRAVPGHHFVVHPPYTLRSLVTIRARMAAAVSADRALFETHTTDIQRGHVATLARLARSPRRWPGLAVYVGVVLAAKTLAARKNRSATAGRWERDDTARAAAASTAAPGNLGGRHIGGRHIGGRHGP